MEGSELILDQTTVCWKGECLQIKLNMKVDATINVEFVSGTLESANLPPFVHHRRLITQPGSKEAIDTIQRWQLQCSSDHSCISTVKNNLPNRLLDVMHGGVEPDVVLAETAGQSGHYICLSYVWGDKAQLMTKVANLEEHKKCIPVQNLPKTATEAIEITRRIGVRWLWIDALCIIQDDRRD
jgi:hypothetical protein